MGASLLAVAKSIYILSNKGLFFLRSFLKMSRLGVLFKLSGMEFQNKAPLVKGELWGAYGKAGSRNPEPEPEPETETETETETEPEPKKWTWRRFCRKSVTNNNCSIKTFHPHIIFIYCYYIFYCRIFCVRRKIFLREFHIRVSVATWDHDWHELTWVLLLPLPPFPHNGWNTEPF